MDILHPPKQARSRATLARLERAAIELIAERGPDGANVQDITSRAKSSVGSFYARFDGKDELMAYLRARVWQDVRNRWDEGAHPHQDPDPGPDSPDRPDQDLDSALMMLVGRVIRAFEPDARARRVLETHRGVRDIEDRARDLVEYLAVGAAEGLAAHSDEITHPQPQLAVRLSLAVLVATARELTETESLDVLRDDLDLSALNAELWRMTRAYLRPGSDGRANGVKDGPAQIEFFDVWG